MEPTEKFTTGKQPCSDFLRGDADIAALGEGNRRNLHQCPVCEGNRAWCDNCHSDHHYNGWETCKPGAYADAASVLCTFTVRANQDCPEIVGAAHALYYWRDEIGDQTGFEITRARIAMQKLNEAWAAVELLYAKPTAETSEAA